MANLNVAELVESWCLLPTQLFPGAADSPERSLVRAVLQRALDDLALIETGSMGPYARRRFRTEITEWFLSEDDSYLYSFASICQVLNLDAGAIRRALFQPQREAA